MTEQEKIGIKINKLTITARDTSSNRNDKWIATCECGNTRIVRWYEFSQGKYKDCGKCGKESPTKFVDITGQTFGKLHVDSYAGNQLWNCTCECGNTRQVRSWDIRNYRVTDCGNCKEYKHSDIIGKQFNEWTVLEYVGKSKFKCRCSCGKIGVVNYNHLVYGQSKSCGHAKLKDITGETFGELTVMARGANIDDWVCQCSCGRTITVKGANLKNGNSKSCGCKASELFKQTMLNKYEVTSYAKIGRDEVQLYALENENNFKEFITKAFDEKPSTYELAVKLGINEANTAKYIHKFKAENLVIMGSELWHSKYEDEIRSLFGDCIQGDRKTLENQEIDLLYTDKHIGIEFNGSYYHSEKFKDKYYHINKTNKALEKGIELIHIFEYEWLNEDIKKKLIALLSRRLQTKELRVIHARNCEVHLIDTNTEKEFLNNYHLQGYSASEIKLGLFYGNELLGIETFGKPRFSTEVEYELIRLCWKDDIAVVGGTEKLFKYFINNYKPKSIISYCNIAKFNGNIYTKLGFKDCGNTEPSYVWFNKSGKVLSRYQTQKQKLIEMKLGSTEQTESEIMHNLEYYKIYDCGNKKFIWTCEVENG